MAFARAFAVGSGPNRLFRAFLWVAAAGVSLVGVRDLLAGYPPFVDIEIPLRAAERWLPAASRTSHRRSWRRLATSSRSSTLRS